MVPGRRSVVAFCEISRYPFCRQIDINHHGWSCNAVGLSDPTKWYRLLRMFDRGEPSPAWPSSLLALGADGSQTPDQKSRMLPGNPTGLPEKRYSFRDS